MASTRIPEPGEPILLGDFFLEDRRFPAVYFLYHRGEVVYVGQTRTLKFRIDQHFSQGVKKFDAVGFIRCKLNELLAWESHYIRLLAPKYNYCTVSKKLRERESWSREHDREEARRTDAFAYHIKQAANCGVIGDDGECYIRPNELGKFLMISDKDAETLFPTTRNVPLMELLCIIAGHRELQKAQERFENLV